MKKLLTATVLQFSTKIAIATFICTVSMFRASAQNPSIQALFQNPWVQVAAATSDSVMFFPRVFGFDMLNGGVLTKKTVMSWQRNPDSVVLVMKNTYSGAYNEPTTWTAPSPTKVQNYGSMDLAGPVRRVSDGLLYSLSFFWGAGPTNPTSLVYWTSADNGNTWTRNSSGHITFPAGRFVGAFRFHRGIIQDADGTLYAPAHGQVKNADGTFTIFRLMLMKSTDAGANWSWISDIHYDPSLNYMEGTIARCKDGSILAVMRSDPNVLRYKRSTNNGVNWSAIAAVPGLPAHQGVDPILEMLPNGVLMLGYGNNLYSSPPYARNCMLAFSADGNGNSWTNVTPTFTSGASPNLTTKNRSTGYTSLLTLRGNRFMQFSDRGDWRYYGTDRTPNPNPQSVHVKTMELELDYKNRIDLKSKYPAGQVTIITDMNYTDATHPMAGVAGAFDGNIYYWNGAFKMAGSGDFTIDLQQPVTINGLSTCLLKGVPQSAQIDCSTDNVNWTPLKTYTNVTHQTVDYTSFTAIAARYVRVHVTGSGSIVGINEFNIFRTADTYEDYAYGGVPVGYVPSDATTPAFWVTEGVAPTPSGYQSKRALFMQDADAANKELRKTGYTASATKTMEFMLRTKGFASGGCVQFRLVSGTTNVFRLAVFSNGVIKYYNGTWNNVGSGPVSVPLDTWKLIKVVANASTNTASVYVDGTLIGSNVTKETVAATSINGFLFASSGSSATGDQALFDDVSLYDQTLTSIASTIASPEQNMGSSTTQKEANANAMSVIASPNPAADFVKISIKHIVPGKLTIYLANIYGKNLKVLNAIANGDNYSVDLPVAQLPLGVYVITAAQNGLVARTKLDKQAN